MMNIFAQATREKTDRATYDRGVAGQLDLALVGAGSGGTGGSQGRAR